MADGLLETHQRKQVPFEYSENQSGYQDYIKSRL